MKDKRALIGMAGLVLLAAGCGREAAVEAVYLDSAQIPIEIRSAYLAKAHIAEGVSVPMIDPQFLFTSAGGEENGRRVVWEQLSASFTLDASALAAFKSRLKPIPAPEYVPAQAPVQWWMTVDEFSALEFYAAAPVMKNTNGFIAVRSSDNTVFMYAEK